MTLDELQAEINDFATHGMDSLVREGAYKAQLATRDYIRRTYPATAFGGKSLIAINGHPEIRCGSFKAEASGMMANIYANYFARWYNTGAKGNIIRGRGKRRGQRGTKYPARGSYFESNADAISNYYLTKVVEHVKNGGILKG